MATAMVRKGSKKPSRAKSLQPSSSFDEYAARRALVKDIWNSTEETKKPRKVIKTLRTDKKSKKVDSKPTKPATLRDTLPNDLRIGASIFAKASEKSKEVQTSKASVNKPKSAAEKSNAVKKHVNTANRAYGQTYIVGVKSPKKKRLPSGVEKAPKQEKSPSKPKSRKASAKTPIPSTLEELSNKLSRDYSLLRIPKKNIKKKKAPTRNQGP